MFSCPALFCVGANTSANPIKTPLLGLSGAAAVEEEGGGLRKSLQTAGRFDEVCDVDVTGWTGPKNIKNIHKNINK